MKPAEMASQAGKSAPYVMTLQKKFGLPTSKDYPEGYAVLVNKLIYISICSVPDKEIKSLLIQEKKLLELLPGAFGVGSKFQGERNHFCGDPSRDER